MEPMVVLIDVRSKSLNVRAKCLSDFFRNSDHKPVGGGSSFSANE